jgi:hypothetical protein
MIENTYFYEFTDLHACVEIAMCSKSGYPM